MLPNGSTDVKSVAVDKNHTFVVCHSFNLPCYQLPTNQLDRGWMATNTLSIIDLKARKMAHFRHLRHSTERSSQSVVRSIGYPWIDKQIIVAAAGSQELVRIDRIALHERLGKAKQGEMVTPSMKASGEYT